MKKAWDSSDIQQKKICAREIRESWLVVCRGERIGRGKETLCATGISKKLEGEREKAFRHN